MSSSLMNKLKWGDGIRVNGVPQRTNFPVKPGDLVTVQLEEEEPEYPAQDGPLTVLYEDDYLLAVDKPAGMLIHPSRAKNEGTLANFVFGYYRKNGQKCAFHPMTRLDRDTFGIVLLAKNAHVHTLLQQGVDVGIFRQQHDAEGIPVQPGHGMKGTFLAGFGIVARHKIG